MNPSARAALLVAVVVVGVEGGGCGRDRRPAADRPASAVTLAEATALARAVAAAAAPCDATKLASLVDEEAFGRRLARAAAGRAPVDRPPVAAWLCRAIVAGSDVGLVAVRGDADGPRPVLRVLATDAALDYLELDLARATPAGPVRVVDVTSYQAGAALSRQLAGQVGDDATAEAASELAAFAQQRERHEAAPLLEAIDRLDRRVGGDPYLADQRAEVYLRDATPERLELAERAARQAVAGLPTREHVWWTLLVVQARRRDHAGVVASLGELERRFGVEIDRDKMAAMTTFRDFMASPEYAAWARAQTASPRPGTDVAP